MQQIERRCKNTNEMLIAELQKLAKECDELMSVYVTRQAAIVKKLQQSQADTEREGLYQHHVSTTGKLGAMSAFKCIVEGQIKSLQKVQAEPTFSRTAYTLQFKVTHERVTGWADKILSKEAPSEIKQHYRPFTKILKTIGNILLPFTVVVPLAKMTFQGRNHFFFNRKTNIENFAGDVQFRLRRYAPPAKKPENKVDEKAKTGGMSLF